MSDDEPLVLSLARKPELQEFLGELGLKAGGLGARLFERVFRNIFEDSLDLRREYDRYYSVEYPQFKDYVEVVHDVYLSDDELDRQYILKIDNLTDLINPAYQDHQLDIVLDCIERLDSKNED
jgi:hypothetical protein